MFSEGSVFCEGSVFREGSDEVRTVQYNYQLSTCAQVQLVVCPHILGVVSMLKMGYSI